MKVGIVGAGSMGTTQAAGWAETPAQIVGFTAETQQEAGKLANRYDAKVYPDLDALIADVDVIDICSPTHLHYEMALKVAAARKHIICEKPFTTELNEADELLKAIRAAAHGGTHLDASLATRSVAGILSRGGDQSGPLITGRERQVLQLMALGHSNKDIASALDVAVKTVEVHKSNAMRKLGLSGRIDVIRYASLQGWLSEP